MNNIKSIILLIGLLGAGCFNARAQEQYPFAVSGPEGIYVMCGNKIPRTFDYQLSRRVVGTPQWESLTTLSFRTNFDGFYNQLLVANGHNNIYELPLETNKGKIWQLIENANDVDSIPFVGAIPMYREALGTCYYDLTAEKTKRYEYKIGIQSADGKVSESISNPAYFPSEKINYNIKLISKNPQERYIHLKYNIANRNRIYTTRLFSSYYMQTGFRQANGTPGLSEVDGTLQAWAIDSAVIKKAIMVYYLQPYDLFGNPGIPSDTVRVINLIDKAETMITALHTQSNQSLQAISLSWKCAVPEFMRSVDVYRSNSYDGEYVSIGSAAPHDTLFVDTQVNVNKNYFYYLIINNAYGQSERSARIAGMLIGNTQAVAPYDFKAEVKPNRVLLHWQKPSSDTYGYYLMRSDEGTLSFRQVGGLIKSDSISVNFVDSVKTTTSSVLTYAVKSVNRSYNVSAMTEPVYVNPILNINLSAPLNLTTHCSDGQVLVSWSDVSEMDNNVFAYRVMRRIAGNAANDTAKFQTLAPGNQDVTLNYYQDKAVKEGITYEYKVVSLSTNTLQSEPSISSTIEIPLFKPVSIATLTVLNTQDGMLINWEATMQENIVQYKVYRWQENKAPLLIATVSADKADKADKLSFIDKQFLKEAQNVYAVTCINGNNIESPIETWTNPQ